MCVLVLEKKVIINFYVNILFQMKIEPEHNNKFIQNYPKNQGIYQIIIYL